MGVVDRATVRGGRMSGCNHTYAQVSDVETADYLQVPGGAVQRHRAPACHGIHEGHSGRYVAQQLFFLVCLP